MPRSVRFCRCTTPLAVCRSTVPEICRSPGASSLQDRERRRRLAAARLAGEAERLAALQLEGDAGDDLDVALLAGVADVQVVNGEDGIAHRRCACGLDSSSTTWPTAKSASTKSVIARPGGTTYHQAPWLIAPAWKPL